MENLIKIIEQIKVNKSNYNKFGGFKYRSCEDICNALRPVLQKYGSLVTLTDEVTHEGNGDYTLTAVATFRDTTGFELSTTATVVVDNHKGMSKEQSFGAASSYARKYALSGLLLLDDEKDADTIQKEDQTKSVDTLKKELAEIKSIKDLSAWKTYNIHQFKGEIRELAIAKYEELKSKQNNETNNN